MQPEYESYEAEIRDGWVGTAVGALCIAVIILAINELFFSKAYVGNGRLGAKSLKTGVALAFAVSLFLVKDARNYDKLEKIRFYLFSLLFFGIFALWIVPFSNRVFPSTLKQEVVEAEIVNVQPANRIRIGKRAAGENALYDLSLRIPAAGKMGTNEVARDGRVAKERYPVLRQKNYIPAEQPIGTTINVRIYHGRWGQDFMLGE